MEIGASHSSSSSSVSGSGYGGDGAAFRPSGIDAVAQSSTASSVIDFLTLRTRLKMKMTVFDHSGDNEVQSNKRAATSVSSYMPPKSKKQYAQRSEIWRHFSREGDEYSKCNYCNIRLKCGSSKNGTSSMNKHLRICKNYKNYGNMLVARGFSQEACRQATVKMIIMDEMPLSIVENVGFRHLCNVLCPKFVVPSRKTITKDVLQMYASEKVTLKSMINGGRVSLTTDIWTSITSVSYMVVTAHFIDSNWQLHRKIISFSPVSDHKGETIAKQLEKCLLDWDIKKVFTITVDNASSNDRAVKMLRSKLKTWGDDALVLDGEFMHVRCYAHILNLIVNEALKEIGDSVSSIRNAVKYVRSSDSRFQAFQVRVLDEKIGRGSLLLDCSTRWNSTYLMLSAALKFRTAFDRMADEDKHYDAYFYEEDTISGRKRVGPPSSSDWENARRMVRFLKIFYDSTLALSASTKVTSSRCFNEICKIEMTLRSMASSDDRVMSSMTSCMIRDKFDKYWDGMDQINKILLVATVLNPQSKMNFAIHCFEKMYENDVVKCGEMKELLLEFIRKLFGVYSAKYKKQSILENGSCSESQEKEYIVDECEEEEYDPWGEFKKLVVDKRKAKDVSNELDIYLMEGLEVQSRNLKFDILLWWKVNSTKFPILAQMARDVFAIPVSTVASESAFSTGGRILDQYRSSLTPNMVEALVLTQNWLRSSFRADTIMSIQQLMDEAEFMDTLFQAYQTQMIDDYET